MKRFTGILAFLIMALLLITFPAHALEITIDPGAVGTSFKEATFGFNDLDGTSLTGQTLDLDFVFNEMKHLTAEFNDDSFTAYFYNVRLTVYHFAGYLPGISFHNGYLSDENGLPLPPVPWARGLGTPVDSFFYNMAFLEPDVDSLIHHDIHFNVTFANEPTAQVISATLWLSISSPDGAIEVGESAPIPEPSTMLLLGTGLLGLAGFRRKFRQ